jgi:hypothetical protein
MVGHVTQVEAYSLSRAFSSGTDKLSIASAVIATRPYSVSLWVKLADISQSQQLFNIATSASDDNRTTLSYFFSGSNQFAANERDTVSQIANSTLTAPSTGVWYHTAAVYTNDSSRAVYTNGANKGTNAGATTPGAFNLTRISGSPTSTAPIAGGGLVAHVGVWNIALSDADVLQLATQTPDRVQAANLIEYWPLTSNSSPEPSSGSQATSFTVTGTAFSTDNPTFPSTTPPMFYQRRTLYFI